MQSNTYYFKTFDNLNLYAQEWKPEGKMKAAVVLVHGLGEHCGRYSHVGEMLVKNGFGLFGFDLRGHGKSEGARGHSPSNEAFNQDINGMLEGVRIRQPEIPVFLYGHSLGGNLVLCYVLRRSPDIRGAIVTAPGLCNALMEQKGKVLLAKLLGTLAPTGVLPSGLDPDSISRDQEVVKNYREDPLVHDRITFGMAKNSIDLIHYVFEYASKFSIPLLLMHGTADQLAYDSGSKEVAALVKGDCTLKLWEGFSHELHNEPGKEEVFLYMLDWLAKH